MNSGRLKEKDGWGRSCLDISELLRYKGQFKVIYNHIYVSFGYDCFCCCFVAKSCSTLFNPIIDHSLPGSSVRGISQTRILKWVAISSSRGSSRPRNQTCISCIADGFFIAKPPGKPSPEIAHSISPERELSNMTTVSIWVHSREKPQSNLNRKSLLTVTGDWNNEIGHSEVKK